MFSSECFFQIPELDILLPDLDVSGPIESSWTSVGSHKLSKSIVTHAIHQRVFHSRRCRAVDGVHSLCVVVFGFHHLWKDTAADSYHPQELVNIVRRVADLSAEDDQHIVDVEFPYNLYRPFLRRSHGIANSRNMCVVSCVIIHQHCPVAHRRDLVAVVPPAHHLRVWSSVEFQPLVSLTEVVKYSLRAISVDSGQDNRGGGVRDGSHPCAMDGIEVEQAQECDADHYSSQQRHRLLLCPFDLVFAHEAKLLNLSEDVSLILGIIFCLRLRWLTGLSVSDFGLL
mmetsp:Transcript_24399/g.43293  ORF Transcript_24399/g.43293 Transcript_24399/m.43293 type:complete len:284 (-) Transcript_24399:1439-2290(-)